MTDSVRSVSGARVRTRSVRDLAGVTLALFAIVGAPAAYPATIAVNHPADGSGPGDGLCTVREALDNANLPGGGDTTTGDCDPGSPGHDTIQIPPLSVTLSAGGPADDLNLGGDLDVLDSVSLVGAGAAATELIGGGSDRLVDVRAGVSGSTIDVQLIGLSLIGGAPPPGSAGGGLRVSPAGVVLVDESAIRDCAADGGGGALNDGDLQVRNSVVIDNRARNGSDGGGILNRRTVDVSGTTLRTNAAGGVGGGIASINQITLFQSELIQNSADLDGGGLATAGSARSEQTNYVGNVATGNGGAIHHASGSLIVVVGSFDQNFAGDGGGAIAALADWDGEELFMVDNRTPRDGGAVLHEGGNATLVGSELRQNRADIDGGALVNRAGFDAMALTIRDNVGVDRGGAIFNDAGAALRLERSSVDDNVVTRDGGGIYNLGELRLFESALTRNTAGGSAGGAFSDGASFLSMRNTTVSRNTAGQTGGGLLLLGAHQVEFSTIARNEANGGGGGLWLGGALEMINTILAGNVGDDCAAVGSLVSLGFNLDSDGSCNLGGPGDLSALAPNLGTLQNNGGSTETHALLPPSPAIDSAEPDCLDLANSPVPDDQRQFGRPEDGDGNGSLICDRGAFERVAPTALPRPVPDGVNGAPLLVGKADPFGVNLELTWDVAVCPSPGYHAAYGTLADVSSYLVSGGLCGLNPIGSDNWNPSASASIWFLVLGNDAAGTESSWGSSSLGTRNGASVSGQCGNFLRDNAPTCP